MKGLILAGGLGTRLRPITHTGPKQLIPIANKPVLHYIIEDMVRAGIKDIGIIVGYTEERIKMITDSLGDGSEWGANITYIEQDAPRGLAHAAWISRDFMAGDDFVMYLGDNMLIEGINKFVNTFKKSDSDIQLILAKMPDPRKFGVAILNNKGVITDVEEKPKDPKSDLVITGIYMFRNNIFDAIATLEPSSRGELEITHAIERYVKDDNKKVTGELVEGWWDDAGNADDILHANHMVLNNIKADNQGTIEEGATVTGNVVIGKNSIIETGASISGPSIIGNNCKIKSGSYIGPHSSIGDNTIIKSGEIMSSILMGDSVIDIEDKKIVNSLIGKGAIITKDISPPKGLKLILGESSEIKI